MPEPVPDKDALEREKLQLEIHALKQPWWQRPGYIAVVLPTTLAIVSLTFAWFNGYFQAASIKLANEKHELEDQVKEFTARRDKLTKAYVSLKAEKRSLEANVSDLNNQWLALQTENGDLTRRNRALETESEGLTRQNLQLDRDRQQLASKVGTLKQEVDLAPVRAFLTKFGADVLPIYSGAEEITEKLRRKPDGPERQLWIATLTDRLSRETSSSHRSVLLGMLYFSTGDRSWRSELFDLYEKAALQGNSIESNNVLWTMSSPGFWSVEDRRMQIQLMARLLRRHLALDVRAHIVWYFADFDLGDRALIQREIPNDYLEIVSSARDVALSTDPNRQQALRALRHLAPSAAMAIASIIFSNPAETELNPRKVEELFEFATNTGDPWPARLDPPANFDHSAWRVWKDKHADLVALWTEPDLNRLRTNEALRVSVLENGVVE